MVPGYQLENVKTLRSLDDAQLIGSQAAGKDVVIVGTSFIGVEVAAALADKAKSVTIVDLVETPFQHALGKEVGGVVKQLLCDKGVKFHFQTTAKEFVGENGKLKQVVLQDGTVLTADFCVVGIGVAPATDFLKDSGVNMSERGFVIVNKQMETNIDSVYAVGDIAQFPLFLVDDNSVNIQHWQMAHQHGRICALNIADKTTAIQSVPYFWTVLFGKSLRYTGYGVGYDDTIIHGCLDDLKFVAFYLKQDKVVAVASMNFDPVVSQAAQLMLRGDVITKTEIQADPLGWSKRL